jgi:hypothetical protein
VNEPTDKDDQDFAAAVPDRPSKLDDMANAQGLSRTPDETDEQLGQRILETANRTAPLVSETGYADKEVSALLNEVVYPGDRIIYAVFKRSSDLNGSVELVAAATTESIAEVIRSRVREGETFIKPIKLYGDHGIPIRSE